MCTRVVLFSWWTSFVSVVVYMCARTQRALMVSLFFFDHPLSLLPDTGSVSEPEAHCWASVWLHGWASGICLSLALIGLWWEACLTILGFFFFLWVLEFWIQALEIPQHLPSPRMAFLYPSLFSESGLSYWHQDWSKNWDREFHWLVLRQYWNCFPLRKEYWEIGGDPHHGLPRPNHPTPRMS